MFLVDCTFKKTLFHPIDTFCLNSSLSDIDVTSLDFFFSFLSYRMNIDFVYLMSLSLDRLINMNIIHIQL